jgi:hypothetical protein
MQFAFFVSAEKRQNALYLTPGCDGHVTGIPSWVPGRELGLSIGGRRNHHTMASQSERRHFNQEDRIQVHTSARCSNPQPNVARCLQYSG